MKMQGFLYPDLSVKLLLHCYLSLGIFREDIKGESISFKCILKIHNKYFVRLQKSDRC